MYYDAHCHYNFLNREYPGYIIAAVSMDYSTSIQTINKKSKNILVGVGIHPWNAEKEKIDNVIPLVKDADFIGEVGLDYRYNPQKDIQLRYFRRFLEIAKELNKPVNVHSLDSWSDVLKLLLDYDIKRAIIHWYSGPIELLRDIEGAGYYITINPSVTFQQKHRLVAEKAPVDIILTESDGGYIYKGRLLEPTQIPELVRYLANIKGVSEEDMNKIIEMNFNKVYIL